MARRLTRTSYALLSLLAVRPWTAYDLSGQMQRSLRYMCPRAESNVYAGMKALVEHGLAERRDEPAGPRRTRSLYAITPAGHDALASWLDVPGAGPEVEFEGLLKTCFSEHGTREDLLATLESVRSWAESALAVGEVVSRDAASADPPYPGRLPQILLTNTFLMDYLDLVRRWATWAADVVRGWETWPPKAVDRELLEAAAALRLPLLPAPAERGDAAS